MIKFLSKVSPYNRNLGIGDVRRYISLRNPRITSGHPNSRAPTRARARTQELIQNPFYHVADK